MKPIPRYIAATAKGAELILDQNRRPLYWRTSRSGRGQPATPETRVSKIISEMDIWVDGGSPAVSEATAWRVRDVLRRWCVWPE